MKAYMKERNNIIWYAFTLSVLVRQNASAYLNIFTVMHIILAFQY